MKGVGVYGIKHRRIGFFKYSAEEPAVVTLLTGHKVQLNIEASFMWQVDDWTIENGMSIDNAVLRSHRLDTSFELWPKVARQYPDCPIADVDESFEMPDAAAHFSGSSSSASASAPSTPASTPGFAFASANSPYGGRVEVRIGGRPEVEAAPPS